MVNKDEYISPIKYVLGVLCAQLTRDLFAIAKFLSFEIQYSPDLNPVDYSVCEALQQIVYNHKISDS